MIFVSPFCLLPYFFYQQLYKATKQYLLHQFRRKNMHFIFVFLLRMCIKTASGEFIVSQKNGGFTAEALDADSATRWEY